MQNKIMWGLAIISIGLIVFCATYMIESYETKIWTGASPEARRNPFLAAQRFLETRSVDVVETTQNLDFKNIPTDQTIILTKVDSMLVSASKIDDALDWIKRGGYMIVGVGTEIEGQSSILKHFEVEPEALEVEVEDAFIDDDDMTTSERLRKLNEEIEEKQKQEAEANAKTNEGSSEKNSSQENSNETDDNIESESSLFELLNQDYHHEYYTLSVDLEDDLYVAALDDIVLNHALIYDYDADESLTRPNYTLNTWASDENGTRLLQFYYGEGSFLALSSSDLWTNDHIGLGDHAYLLSYLVPDNSQLKIFYNIESPTLFTIIYRYFYELVWCALALLALWLWYRGIRTQRVHPIPSSGRRIFADHLRSSAEFLTRTKQYSALLAPIKDDIELQLRTQYPNFKTLDESTQVAILTEQSGLKKSLVSNWVKYCTAIKTREQLFTALKIGNAIRKQL